MPRPAPIRRVPVRHFHVPSPRPITHHPTPRRSYQSLPSLGDKGFADVVFHLDTTRASRLLHHQEPQDLLDHLQLCSRHMASDPLAWQQAVRKIDRAPRSAQLTPVGSLALVMRVMRAAERFAGEMATPAFVSLVANLQPLARLVLCAGHQDQLARFARAAVQLAVDSLPCGGTAFFGMPAPRRIALFARFIERIVSAASDMGMGIHDDDREQFVVEARGEASFAGRFDVLEDSADWPAIARFSLGGPIGIGDALTSPDVANSQFAMLIDVAVHEVIHACQNSLVDRTSFAAGRGFSSDTQYHDALTALIGSTVDDFASRAGAIDPCDPVLRTMWLPLHEQPAWFASWMARESLAKSGFFEPEVRRAARMNHPMERDAIARLVGVRPRAEVTVCESESDVVRLHEGSLALPAGHFRLITEPFQLLDAQEDAALDERAQALALALAR